MSLEDALLRVATWDSGGTIWSIEMGGLGPAYEQAIQILAIEIIRDEMANPLPVLPYGRWGYATVSRIDAPDPVTGKCACGGFSGAQVSAAQLIAYRFLSFGAVGFDKFIPKDRRIQVNRFYPVAPPKPHVEDATRDQAAKPDEAKE